MNVETALALHASGNISGAEQAYRQLLSADAANVVALEKLGLICIMTGRLDEAIGLLSAALKLKPDSPETLLNLAVAYKTQGQLKEAISCNQRALDLGANYPEAYLNLGDVLKADGQPEAAISSYCKALELRATYAEAHNNLGLVHLDRNNLCDAENCFRKAIQIKPAFLEAHNNLGIALRKQGRFDEAIAAFKAVVKLLPSAEAHLNLGSILFESGRITHDKTFLSESVSAYKKALALKPDYAEAYQNLGVALFKLKLLDDAAAAFMKAIRINPNLWQAQRNLGLLRQKQEVQEEAVDCFERALKLQCQNIPGNSAVKNVARKLLQLMRLPIVYGHTAEIQRARNAYASALADAASLIAEMSRPFDQRELDLLRPILFSITNFFLAYQQLDDRELQIAYADLVVQILKPEIDPYLSLNESAEQSPPSLKSSSRSSPRKIRLGLASEHLRFHHGSYWAYGWLANLPQNDYELFLYSLNGEIDDMTKKFAELGTFRWLPFDDDGSYMQALKTIKEDKLDILLLTDVGMSPSNLIVSLLRLAPVQCAAWGHPVTTGSANIDYFLSSELMEPEHSQAHYSEQLVKLPNIGLCLEYPDDPEEAGDRSSFGIPEDRTVYGSVQSLFKYLPQFDFIFPAIAKEVPDSLFVFVASEYEATTARFRKRLQHAFKEAGINFEKHVSILPRMSLARFMCLLRVIDVNLDSIGWSGALTTMRSLVADCPVVAYPTEFMRGRASAAMLNMVGLPELIAGDVDEYIKLSVDLGVDRQLRSSLIARIKQNKDKLFNDGECVEALDRFLKEKSAAIQEAACAKEAVGSEN